MSTTRLHKRLSVLAEPQIDELVRQCWRAVRTAQAPLSMRQVTVYEMADALVFDEHHKDAQERATALEWKRLVTEAGFYKAYDPLVQLTGSPDKAVARLNAYMVPLQERSIQNHSTLTDDERFLLGYGSATDRWLRSLPDAAVERLVQCPNDAKSGDLEAMRRDCATYLAIVDELLEHYPEPHQILIEI